MTLCDSQSMADRGPVPSCPNAGRDPQRNAETQAALVRIQHHRFRHVDLLGRDVANIGIDRYANESNKHQKNQCFDDPAHLVPFLVVMPDGRIRAAVVAASLAHKVGDAGVVQNLYSILRTDAPLTGVQFPAMRRGADE